MLSRYKKYKKYFPVIFLYAFYFFSCGPDKIEIRNDFRKFYDRRGYQGSFALHDLNNDRWIIYDKKKCNRRYPPASTFKIFNTLVGLETGVIQDENTFFVWDSIIRQYPSWNKDQTLRTAFRNSVVWCYQEIARQVGRERMQYYIEKCKYGNKNISNVIDSFWFDGSLRISQIEQIFFLEKLYKLELPFSKKNQKIVKNLLLREQTPEYKLSSKTGTEKKYNMGLYIGYIEREENVYFFTSNIYGNSKHKTFYFAKIRVPLEILRELELL
ncbi:MAG: class D beta-lactamase [Bacteroidia bacterium]|nr:class D beta-lactamase [Bacteroidia bacterium]